MDKWEHLGCVLGLLNGIATVENSVVFSQKLKNKMTVLYLSGFHRIRTNRGFQRKEQKENYYEELTPDYGGLLCRLESPKIQWYDSV